MGLGFRVGVEDGRLQAVGFRLTTRRGAGGGCGVLGVWGEA